MSRWGGHEGRKSTARALRSTRWFRTVAGRLCMQACVQGQAETARPGWAAQRPGHRAAPLPSRSWAESPYRSLSADVGKGDVILRLAEALRVSFLRYSRGVPARLDDRQRHDCQTRGRTYHQAALLQAPTHPSVQHNASSPSSASLMPLACAKRKCASAASQRCRRRSMIPLFSCTLPLRQQTWGGQGKPRQAPVQPRQNKHGGCTVVAEGGLKAGSDGRLPSLPHPPGVHRV